MSAVIDLVTNLGIEVPAELASDVLGAVDTALGVSELIDDILTLIESTLSFMMGVINQILNDLQIFIETISLVETMIGFLVIMLIIAFIIFIVIECLNNLKKGIRNHVNCGAKEFKYGGENFAFTIKIMWDCFWDKLVLFFNGDCTVYYITDIIFGIVYAIIIELPIVLIRAIFGINLQPIVNDIYQIAILPLNDLVYFVSGFYLIKWPESVIKKCFRCRGVYKTSSGENVELYKTFNEWAQLNKCNTDQMRNGFVKIFQSIIPSPKWTAWTNGQELPGWTNNPAF